MKLPSRRMTIAGLRWPALAALACGLVLVSCQRTDCSLRFRVYEPGAGCWTLHFGEPPWLGPEGSCNPGIPTRHVYAYEGACWTGSFCSDPEPDERHRMPPDVRAECYRVNIEYGTAEICPDVETECRGRNSW